MEEKHVVHQLIKIFGKKNEMDQCQIEVRSYLDFTKKNEDEIRFRLMRTSDREY